MSEFSSMVGRRVASALVLVGLALSPTRGQAGLTQNATMQHGGITRHWDYYTPAGGMPASPVPVVFVLHGGNGDNKDVEGASSPSSEWMDLADANQFLVIFPNGVDAETGLSGASGNFNWNDCRADAGSAATTADDVGFVSALIDWAYASFDVDLERVYATGSSNGGMMAHRLALELSDAIAAIGGAIANRPVNSDCALSQPANPIAVLMMNGTADPLMPWNGGTAGQGGEVESAAATRDYYRTFLGTGATPAHTDFPNINTGDGSTVALDLYANGAQGTAVAFYTVSGGGHSMPSVDHYIGLLAEIIAGKQNRDIEGASRIWDFFEQHGLNGPIVSPTTVTLTSVAADDGWMLESSETSGSGGSTNSTSGTSGALRVGDDSSDRQYQTIVSFDTSSIPDGATVLSAEVRLRRGLLAGTNPFGTHGACYVDVKGGAGFGGSSALASGDFQSTADAARCATMSNPTSSGDWSTGSLDAAGRAAINKTGKTQLRVYLSIDDNDDRGNDYVGFYSGDSGTAGNRPQLVVQYQ